MDLATSHSSESNLFLRANGIKFVEKSYNAPNVPQVRPIEQFLALCKGEAVPKSLVWPLRSKWREISQKVALDHGKSLMSELRANFAKLGRG